jgi:hypothetical protein
MLPWIAGRRAAVGVQVWNAAVQCLQQSRVAEHNLSAHEWLDDGMYLEAATQEWLLASSHIDESTPQPMQALFLRIITVHREAGAAAAEANTPGAGVPRPAAPEAALAPAARAAAGRATAAAEETQAAGAAAAASAAAPVAGPAATAVAAASGRDLGHSTGTAAAAEAPPETAEERRHPGGGQQPLRQVHVEFMVAYRRRHAARAGDTSGSHVCGWCGHVETNISHLRAHMQRSNCATAGAWVAEYYRGAIAIRELQWTEHGSQHQRRTPAPANDASDALRRRSDRPKGTGGRAASGGSSGAGSGSGATRNSEMLHSRLRSGDRVRQEAGGAVLRWGRSTSGPEGGAQRGRGVRVVDGRAQWRGSQHPDDPARTTRTELREAWGAPASTGSSGDDGTAGAGTTHAAHGGVEQ